MKFTVDWTFIKRSNIITLIWCCKDIQVGNVAVLNKNISKVKLLPKDILNNMKLKIILKRLNNCSSD